MPTYFKPLRRKIGLLTLMAAGVCGLCSDVLIASERYHVVGELMRTVSLPLTLLSAWLLLSKVRKKTETPTPDSIGEKA